MKLLKESRKKKEIIERKQQEIIEETDAKKTEWCKRTTEIIEELFLYYSFMQRYVALCSVITQGKYTSGVNKIPFTIKIQNNSEEQLETAKDLTF